MGKENFDNLLESLRSTSSAKLKAMTESIKGIKDKKSIITEYEKAVASIHKLCGEVDSTALLATMASNNLLVRVDVSPELDQPERLDQSQIELLQALTLQRKADRSPKREVSNADISSLGDTLIKLWSLAILYRAKSAKAGKEKELVLENVRASAQTLRSSAYPQQIRRITKDLFSGLNDLFQKHCGVQAEALVDLIFAIVEAVEERANVVQMMKAMNLAPAHCDTSLIYIFSKSELRKLYPGTVSDRSLQAVLTAWSFKYGDLETSDSKLFMLDNPVVSKPFIQLEDGTYFCPVAGSLISSCTILLEKLIENIGEAEKERYHFRRGKFLEEEAQRIFTSGFPAASVASNVKWGFGPQAEGECDIVVDLKPYLILCECKGHRPSDTAMRGAPESLQDTITKMVVEPNSQSARFEDWLRENAGPQTLKCSEGTVTVDIRTTPLVVRLSTNFEILTGKISNWRMLELAGFTNTGNEGSPTIPITDLECIFEILPTQSQRLHYLIRRFSIENQFAMSTDELSLLYVYLSNSLLDPLPLELTCSPLGDGLAIGLDDYFMQQWTGIKVSKPLHQITEWTKQMLEGLEGVPYGMYTGNLLLNLGSSGQRVVKQRIDAIVERVKNTPLDESLNNIFRAVSKDDYYSLVFLVLAYKSLPEPEQLLQQIVTTNFDQIDTSVVFGIGIDAECPKQPYNLACIALPNYE